MAEWMEMLQYDKLDLLMIVNPHSTDAVVRSLVSRLKGNGKPILKQIESWIDYEVSDILAILCRSAFMTPALERHLLPHLKNGMFQRGGRYISAHFHLQFPPKIILSAYTLNMGLNISAQKAGEMGMRDVVVAAAELSLHELTSIMLEDISGGAASFRQLREHGEEAISKGSLNCWTKLLHTIYN